MKIFKSINEFIKKHQHYIRILGLILGFAILTRQLIILLLNINHNFLEYLTWSEVFVSFIFIILALIMQIISWKFIMNLININIPIFGAIQGYMLSFLPKYIPGTVWGYLSRNEWLKNDYKVDNYITTIGSFLEIFLIFISTLNFLIIYFVIVLNKFLLVFLSIILIVLSFFSIKIILNFQIPFINTKTKKIKLSLKFWFFGIFSETIMWIFYGVSIHFLIIDNTNFIDFFSILYSIISFNLAWFMGFIIVFIPSGIGVREELLANLLNYHFNFGYLNALGIGFLLRILISIGELFLSAVGLLYKRNKLKL